MKPNSTLYHTRIGLCMVLDQQFFNFLSQYTLNLVLLFSQIFVLSKRLNYDYKQVISDNLCTPV